MTKRILRVLSLWIGAVVFTAWCGFAADPDLPAKVSADRVSVSSDLSTVTLSGHVVVESHDVKIFCDEATLDKTTKTVRCKGETFIYRDRRFFVGQDTVYDFGKNGGMSRNFRALDLPMYFQGENVRQVDRNLMVIDHGTMSTCDEGTPHYTMRASKIDLYVGEKAVAHNVTMYAGKVPFFWWPRWTHHFDDRPPFHVTPGRNSRWGEYLLSGYSPKFKPIDGVRVRPTFNVDYRTKRGWAGGVEVKVEDREEERIKSNLYTYFLNDHGYEPIFADPSQDDPQRYWLNLYHQQQFYFDSTLVVNLDKESDEDLVYEYFQNDFESENQRTNFVDLSKSYGLFYFDLYTEFQVNDFNTVVERLPQLKVDQRGIPLWDTDFYYTSNASAARLNYAFSKRTEESMRAAGQDPGKYEIGRFDTLHEVSYAKKFFGWLNVEPWVGFEYTHFSDSPEGDALDRMVYNPGVTLYTKFYRVFEDVQSDFWQLDRLRHIVQPYVTYDYIPTPNIRPSRLYQFDSVDAVDRKNRFELGVKNLFQTKREDEDNLSTPTVSYDWIRSNVYTYYYPDPEQSGMDNHFGNLFWDNNFMLLRWLQISENLRYNPYDHKLVSADTDLTVFQDELWGVTLGHRYLQDNDNFLTADLNAYITPDWSAKYSERYNYREHFSQEHEFTLHRDLHCWDVSLTYGFRRNVNLKGADEHAVYLTMGIKEFTGQGVRSRF